MQRTLTWAALLVGLVLLVHTQPAAALITADYPLKNAVNSMQHIFIAKVEQFDPAKLRMVLVVGDDLKKNKPAYGKLLVSFAKPDDDAKDGDHLPKLLKRLANDLPVVMFVEVRGKKSIAMGYTNGTWFQMICDDPANQPWLFTHCEIYLRRTFKGTTQEMRQVIDDYLTQKKEPPATNPKEPPGFGPEVAVPDEKGQGPGARGPGPAVFAVIEPLPLLGVIPTVAIGGPLAILSMLFPSLFGKPKEILKRYLALLTVASVNSILYLLAWAFEQTIRDYWWGTPLALWSFMGAVTVLGLVWALRRQKAMPNTAEQALPQRGEVIAFQVLSAAGLAVAAYLLGCGQLFKAGGREVLVFCAVAWAGLLGIGYFRWLARRAPEATPRVPLEGVMLAGLTLACAWMSYLLLPGSAAEVPNPGGHLAGPGGPDGPLVHAGSWAAPQLQPDRAWTFSPKGTNGTMDSTPLVTDKYVYLAVKIAGGFSNYGRVYCLDRASRKEFWSFDDDGEMKAVFSTPFLAEGRLYIGEGYHQDRRCKLYCLDAGTGRKIWEFKTKSHTESSPCVSAGRVYCGAGDDGLYCLDAKTGEALWNYPNVHVDAAPAVAGNRVFCGSGIGDVHRETAVFCLDADTGKELWRLPTDLPVWGSPVADGGLVYFGIGNGNFIEDADKPAGALMCIDGQRGQRLWYYPVPNGILNRPAVDRQTVYFTCRDGNCYAVDRYDGRGRWKRNLGSPVVTSPALVICPQCGNGHTLYVAASAGQVFCLDTASGGIAWTFDVAKHSGKKPMLFSSPRVVVSSDGKEERRRIFFGAGLETLAEWQAALYCLEDKLPAAAGTASAPRFQQSVER